MRRCWWCRRDRCRRRGDKTVSLSRVSASSCRTRRREERTCFSVLTSRQRVDDVRSTHLSRLNTTGVSSGRSSSGWHRHHLDGNKVWTQRDTRKIRSTFAAPSCASFETLLTHGELEISSGSRNATRAFSSNFLIRRVSRATRTSPLSPWLV
ncbi:hypothetical protein EXIGLDRAFT_812216 [Exidia glandulosa HHB12029]|uniref:Uncharacterized protein n=1 Tax=Exidia glandulosa HHB12029 TaxID=1314781 RepID=A0A165ZEL5_EXIGL|nr:hypothetical protein EXIGLDRAFT_812216 [Exidia glandulosa HHB12029]